MLLQLLEHLIHVQVLSVQQAAIKKTQDYRKTDKKKKTLHLSLLQNPDTTLNNPKHEKKGDNLNNNNKLLDIRIS
jgi:hypothetical protein